MNKVSKKSGFKKNGGFSLLEMLVVVGIIMILSTIGISVINPKNLIDKANDAKRKTDLSRIRTAMEEFYNDKGCFPNETDINTYGLKTTCGTNSFGTWLPKWPCDPSGNKYILEVETDDEGIIKVCPKWFKVYANLANKQDKDIPLGWYSMGSLVLSGNYGVDQVNYGVSSTNINWNSVSSVNYGAIPTPTSAPVSGGTNLSNLVVKLTKNTLLTYPTFSPSNLNYSVGLPNVPLTVAIIPTLETIGSTVTVNSIPATSGVATPVLIDSSPKTVLIVVTSPDHLSTKTYRVIFSSPPYLSNLALKMGMSTNIPLNSSFEKTVFAYTAEVASGALSVKVIPTAEDSNSTITVNGSTVQSGQQLSVGLTTGQNNINVVVTSPMGTNTYSLVVTRPPAPTL